MFGKFGKLGGASFKSLPNKPSPPVISPTDKEVDGETADSSFNPDDGDEIYDGKDSTDNTIDNTLNGGKSK